MGINVGRLGVDKTRKPTILGLVVLLAFGTLVNVRNVDAIATGDGSLESPYQITTCEELQEVSNDLAAFYELASSIDCNSTTMSPIGTSATPFTGSFDGMGNTISNATVTAATNDVGIFGSTDGATITNLHIIDSSITGQASVGGIVGYAGNSTLSYLSSTSTTISGSGSAVGGVVGGLGGSTIERSFADGNDVIGLSSYVGGLVGWAVGPSTVSNSYTTGTVSGPSEVGGVIGQLGVGPSIATNNYANVSFLDAGSDVIGAVAMGGSENGNFMVSAPYLSNNTQPPLNTWDFDSIWYVRNGNYPGLRPNVTLSMLCNAPSSTDTTLSASCTSFPENLQTTLTWEIQYKPASKLAWISRPGQTTDTFVDTVTGLLQGTDYTVRFRHTSILGVSEWGTIDITTTGASDLDGDNVSNIDEDYAPNSGDANNDGIKDYMQAEVSSILNTSTNRYVTVQTSCADNFNVAVGMEASGAQADANFDYNSGLVSFVGRSCGVGATVQVNIRFYGATDTAPMLRKYRNGAYSAVLATFTSSIVGGQTSWLASYQIVDGGVLDDDGIADGNVVDPVGLALSLVGAPNTGIRPL